MIISITIPICADSISLNPIITNVYNGPDNFGMGFAPLGASFLYTKSFPLSKKLPYQAYFSANTFFNVSDNNSFGGINYKTGTPEWINKYVDIKDIDEYNLEGKFLNITASIELSLFQGFGINPVTKEGPLLNLGLIYNTRYSSTLETLSAYKNESAPVFINKNTGSYNPVFAPGQKIPAYPWLQDTRNNFTNSLKIIAGLILYKPTGFRTNDGLYATAYIELAPFWMGNNLSMAFPTADYFIVGTEIYEYLTLYSKQQQNGLNWLTIQLTHWNNLQHTGGNIVPQHKIPPDRFENTFYDAIILDINGPQFVANDSYTNLSIGFNNACYWGNIVNEASKTSHAVEWTSSLNITFHAQLFGFMHFKYDFAYIFFSGIHPWYPEFTQKAHVTFYISL